MLFYLQLLPIVFLCFLDATAWSQSIYVDYSPEYKTWANTYQIDKIEQTSSELVIHFRFARDNNKYDNPSFYPSKHEFAWVLETKDGTVYHWNRLSNIARNGVAQIVDLGAETQSVEALTKEKKSKTFFTCQIHFDALPDALTEISLVQGKGLRENRNHLNCLEIQLKKQSNGSVGIEKERIAVFEKQMLTPPIPVSISRQAEKEIEIKRIWQEDLDFYANGAVVDDQPVYEEWQPNYFLDRIVYTKTEMIFFVRFILDLETSGGATFYTENPNDTWFLQSLASGKKYHLKSITNIKKNGILTKEKVVKSDIVWHEELATTPKTIVTCQIHFEKLPEDAKRVNLIEGEGREKDVRRFNFFKIMIMPTLAKKVR